MMKHWQDKEWALERGERHGTQLQMKAEEKRKERQRDRAKEKRSWGQESRSHA